MADGNMFEKAERKPSFLTRFLSSFRDREDHATAPVMEILEARVLLSASPLPVDDGQQYLNDNQAVICMPISVDNADTPIPVADHNAADITDSEIQPVLVQTVAATTAEDVKAPVITINPYDNYIHKSTIGVSTRITDADSETVNWTARLIIHATGEERIIGSGDTPSQSYHNLVTVSSASYPDGRYTVIVEATDAAGNHSEKTCSFTLDSTPPEVSIVAESERFEVGTTVFNIVATDESGIYARSMTINGKSVAVDRNIGRAAYTFTQPGTYTLVATASDMAGNYGTVTRTIVITENTDFTAPTIDIISPASGSYTNATYAILVASIDDAEGGYLSWTVRIYLPSGQAVTVATGEGAVFNAAVASRSVGSGTHTYEIEAVDAAGNVTMATSTFHVDRTAPTIKLGLERGEPKSDTWYNNPANSWHTAPLTLTGSITDDFSPIDLLSWRVILTNIDTGQSFVHATGMGNPANGIFTVVDPSDYVGGRYEYRIEATDYAGNVSTRSTTGYMDGTPPDFSYTCYFEADRPGFLVFDILASDDVEVETCFFGILSTPKNPNANGGGGHCYYTSTVRSLSAALRDGPGLYTLIVGVRDIAHNESYVTLTVYLPPF